LVIMLPGVPGEMRKLLEHEVAPRLAARSTGSVIRSRVVRTTGVAESALAERLGEIDAEVAPLTLAYLPGFDGVDLRLSAWSLPADEADARLAAGAVLLRERAGACAYGQGDDDLAALVLERARQAGRRVGTAESCTGGLVGGRLTEIPGSSDVFVGGVICYADEVKTELLGVDPALIAAEGAVSEPVARAMATGATRVLDVDLAVAVTGIAGPGGGSEAKPVGTVWLAVADRDTVQALLIRVPGDRQNVRTRSAQAALHLLYHTLGQERPAS
jgi:nicotinamide-nucleotide amidase